MTGSGLSTRAAAALAVAFAAGGCVASPSGTPADNSVVAATTTAGAAKPPAAVKPPRVLLDQRGNGSKATAPFATTRPWKMTYDYDCSASAGGSSNFIVFVYDGTDLVDSAVNELGKGGRSETNSYHTGPQLHLQILAGCPWHIRVTG